MADNFMFFFLRVDEIRISHVFYLEPDEHLLIYAWLLHLHDGWQLFTWEMVGNHYLHAFKAGWHSRGPCRLFFLPVMLKLTSIANRNCLV